MPPRYEGKRTAFQVVGIYRRRIRIELDVAQVVRRDIATQLRAVPCDFFCSRSVLGLSALKLGSLQPYLLFTHIVVVCYQRTIRSKSLVCLFSEIAFGKLAASLDMGNRRSVVAGHARQVTLSQRRGVEICRQGRADFAVKLCNGLWLTSHERSRRVATACVHPDFQRSYVPALTGDIGQGCGIGVHTLSHIPPTGLRGDHVARRSRYGPGVDCPRSRRRGTAGDRPHGRPDELCWSPIPLTRLVTGHTTATTAGARDGDDGAETTPPGADGLADARSKARIATRIRIGPPLPDRR